MRANTRHPEARDLARLLDPLFSRFLSVIEEDPSLEAVEGLTTPQARAYHVYQNRLQQNA